MRHFLRDVAVQVIGGVIVAVVIRFMLNQNAVAPVGGEALLPGRKFEMINLGRVPHGAVGVDALAALLFQ